MRPFRTHRTAVLLATCLAALSTSAAAQPVEVSHPVAPFLRRLEEKKLIPPGFRSTLPRDAAEIADALRQAEARKAELPAWDRRKLDRYLSEFDPERRWNGTRLRYRDSSFALLGHLEYFTGIYARDSVPKAETYAFGSFTPGVDGTYGDNVYFTVSGTVSMERNVHERFTQNYDPRRGLPYNADTDVPMTRVSTFDGMRAVVGFGDRALRLEAGQDWNQWGPGHWQRATLGTRPHFWAADSLGPSDPTSMAVFPGNGGDFMKVRRGYRYPGEGAPLPQIRLRMGGRSWNYVKIVARRTGLSSDSLAYLVAHRLQVRLGPVTLGGTEMLISARPLDGLVLLPGLPLKIAEHSGGDRDNVVMSGDLEWQWGQGSLYGELMLDDFKGLPLDYWVNKLAWTVGGSWQDPLGTPATLRAEYARVNPFVYGHYLYDTQMQHYGALLGSSLPPNSQAVFASATLPLPFLAPFRALDAEGGLEWSWRQRDVKPRGSSLFDDYILNRPPDRAEFLERDVETRSAVTATAEWNWRHRAHFKAGVGGLWVSNWKGNPGVTVATPTASGEITLKY